jgi:hypothetical protein
VDRSVQNGLGRTMPRGGHNLHGLIHDDIPTFISQMLKRGLHTRPHNIMKEDERVLLGEGRCSVGIQRSARVQVIAVNENKRPFSLYGRIRPVA